MATDAPRAETALSVEERERVVQELRQLPGMRRLGQRLLADLVDRSRQSWRSFQWHLASRIFGQEADAFIEFPPSSISIMEPVLFAFARRIAAAALRDEEQIRREIGNLIDVWGQLP